MTKVDGIDFYEDDEGAKYVRQPKASPTDRKLACGRCGTPVIIYSPYTHAQPESVCPQCSPDDPIVAKFAEVHARGIETAESRRARRMLREEKDQPMAFLVLVDDGRVVEGKFDRKRAMELAENVHGAVVAVPIIADFRE